MNGIFFELLNGVKSRNNLAKNDVHYLKIFTPPAATFSQLPTPSAASFLTRRNYILRRDLATAAVNSS